MNEELFRKVISITINVLSFGLLYLIRLVAKKYKKRAITDMTERILDKDQDGDVDADDLFKSVTGVAVKGSDDDD